VVTTTGAGAGTGDVAVGASAAMLLVRNDTFESRAFNAFEDGG
jgi:hypothetical protein